MRRSTRPQVGANHDECSAACIDCAVLAQLLCVLQWIVTRMFLFLLLDKGKNY